MPCLVKQEMGYFTINNAQVHFNNTPRCHLRNCFAFIDQSGKLKYLKTLCGLISLGTDRKKGNQYIPVPKLHHIATLPNSLK